MRLWHGGRSGLQVGDELLSPDEAGLEWTSRAINEGSELQNPNYRTDRVYATIDRDLAHAFAAYWTREPRREGGGWLYEVEFDDDLIEEDADFPSMTGVSFQAPRGRVLAIAQKGVGWQPKHSKIFNRILSDANSRAHERRSTAGDATPAVGGTD